MICLKDFCCKNKGIPLSSRMFTSVSLLRRNSGFAVVLALSIMTLVTLVVLSLSALLVVEQRGAETRLLRLSAEANARLALNLAIGQLQKGIGTDARITSPELGNEPVTGEDHWTAAYEAWPYAADEADLPDDDASVGGFSTIDNRLIDESYAC